MIVKSEAGVTISIVRFNGIAAFDRNGGEWNRDYKLDESDRRGFCFVGTKDKFFLSMKEMSRITKGPKSINAITTVEELRDAVNDLPDSLKRTVDAWPDQKLRELLIESEENSESPIEVLLKKLPETSNPASPTTMPTEAPSKPTEKQRTPKRYSNTTQRRKQEGSVSVAFGDTSVLLTPKQLEFMERLSECPDWEKYGPTGEYVASEYAQELSDTMNPMSMGAVLTTLREKDLLQTDKRRVGPIKCCVFKLTDLGVQVYNSLTRKGVK